MCYSFLPEAGNSVGMQAPLSIFRGHTHLHTQAESVVRIERNIAIIRELLRIWMHENASDIRNSF